MMRICVSILLILLPLCGGCGPNVGLGGKVTFSDDGSPLAVGSVVFLKGSLISRGDLQPNGTYVVGSLSDKDGLPPGTYMVYVSGAEKIIIPPGKTEDDAYREPLIDSKFTQPETSGLTLEVTKSTKKFDFQVDRYAKKKK
jgi:hypothetical protein